MPLKRIDEIDGLRAIAMSMVVAQHCGLMPFGWNGVWLFFVISGYVISRNFLKHQYDAQSAPSEYYLFMKKRFFRIVPLYSFYIFINVLVLFAVANYEAFKELPFLLTFLYNWQMIFQFWPSETHHSAFGHLWTLSVEEQFYIVYPLLFLFLPRRQYLWALIALVIAGPLIRYAFSDLLSAISDDAGWKAFAIYAASFAHFDAFIIGALIANFEPLLRSRKAIAHGLAAVAVVGFGIYAATYVFINIQNGAHGVDALRNVISGILYGQGREVFVYLAIDLVCAATLIYAILQMPFMRWLARFGLPYIGRISYGGYVYHALVLWCFKELLIGAPVSSLEVPLRLFYFAVVWTITAVVAGISFRYLEKPIMDWANNHETLLQPSFRLRKMVKEAEEKA